MLNKFVVIDLETTGNLPKKGEKIIQFAAVVIENGEITEKFSSLINPQKPIPAFIEELTGLHDDMVKEAPIFSEIASKIIALLDNAYFVAHNVLFDLSFLQEELLQAGYEGFFGPVLDTVELARFLYPTADSYKLSDLAERENLRHDRPHQADSDAEVTAELLQIFLNRLYLLPQKVLEKLMILSGGLKSDIQLLLDEILLEKSNKVEELPNTLEIFNGIALKKSHHQRDESFNEESYCYPENTDEKIKILKNAFDSFEERMGQLEMMDRVYHTFLNQNYTLIEAGTGIGKSIGYLFPAAYFSKNHHLPVIVSTHTTQLQEQLINKEVPILSKMVPFHVKCVLLKGRSHYLNLDRFIRTLMDENDNYDTTLTKMQILIWLMDTKTGDKDELNLSSGGLIYWNKIKSEQLIFSHNEEWLERDFYIRAKKEAAKADIIITNHSLLLSDLTAKHKVLPEYAYAIIDEGHHLEKTASHFLGHTLDYLTVRLLLSQLGLYEQKLLFYRLESLLNMADGKQVDIPTLKLNELITNLFFEMDEFFKMAAQLAIRKAENRKESKRLKIKLSKKEFEKELTILGHCAERFAFLIKDVQLSIEKRIDFIKKQFAFLSNEQKNLLEEFNLFLLDFADLRDTIREIMINDSGHVKWIEIDVRSTQNVTTIFAEPASVANMLKSQFFQMKKGIVVTSATLTVNQSYKFIMKELGLDSSAVNTLTIPSPFHYQNQVQLLIPDDLPQVKEVSMEEYVIAITEHLITIAEATRGRMLILFTSHEMLRKTYELIKESGFLEDFAIIAQGITSGSRTRLTRNFQRYEKAILLGTSSFWEGIDIPGEDLSCLVIVRLPFSSPEEPYTEAKCEFVKQHGGNPFTDYSLPEAILRFKQGFGRLIRTEKDKGIMVIFDKRIVTTKYGHAFLKSIPTVPVKNGAIEELVDIIRLWL
ncbi:MAG TPA: ATP-dependent DNA helicase DinG [Bacillales bacterium]|nr:ATP-dependent DNA helicase DinG [Bacillales bacterium]